MYYPQPSREPNGCLQSLIITKMIMLILAVPLGIIFLAVVAMVGTFYALSVHPLLALALILAAGAVIVAAAKWEYQRVSKEIPRDE